MDKSIPRLFLSQIGENFSPEKDYVLGPWCFLGREEQMKDWKGGQFIETFDTPEEKLIAAKECGVLAEFFVRKTADRLNALHSRNYPYYYWYPLLIRWALTLIHAYWRRWLTILKFIDVNGKKEMRVVIDLGEHTEPWEFETTISLINDGLLNEAFDYIIMSSIIKKLAPKNWILEPASYSIKFENKTVIKSDQDPNTTLKSRLRKKLGHLPFSDVPGVGAGLTILFSLYINILTKPKMLDKVDRKYPLNPPKYFSDEFIGLIDDLLVKLLPATFGNNFKFYEKGAKSHMYKKGRLFITGAAHAVDENNFKVAHALLNGERVVWCQHGSHYGVAENGFSLALYEYAYNAFFTWGWLRHGNLPGKFIRAPSPLLSKYKGKHSQKNNKIILVGTRTWVRSVRIDHSTEPTAAFAYRLAKVRFTRALEKRVLKRLWYRPYMRGKMDLEDVNFYKREFPEVPILTKNLHGEMLASSLIVFDHLGTTLHFAMAMGVPVVCYWNYQDWDITPTARQYFENLKEVNILFSNPEDAAAHINRVVPAIADWWEGDRVKEVRKNWGDQFSFSKKYWWLDWFRVLRTV